jgi:hypothetical protein
MTTEHSIAATRRRRQRPQWPHAAPVHQRAANAAAKAALRRQSAIASLTTPRIPVRRDLPTVAAVGIVEPGAHPLKPFAEAGRRYGDNEARRKAALGFNGKLSRSGDHAGHGWRLELPPVNAWRAPAYRSAL